MTANRCHAELAIAVVEELAAPFVDAACVVEAFSRREIIVGEDFGNALRKRWLLSHHKHNHIVVKFEFLLLLLYFFSFIFTKQMFQTILLFIYF